MKKLKINQNKIPMITYPVKGLNLKEFVIDELPTTSYDIKPEEFYQDKDIVEH